MPLTGNKGEWSEIYTLFRLLGEGKVHAGDENLNKLELYYPILNVIREESKKYEYKCAYHIHHKHLISQFFNHFPHSVSDTPYLARY